MEIKKLFVFFLFLFSFSFVSVHAESPSLLENIINMHEKETTEVKEENTTETNTTEIKEENTTEIKQDTTEIKKENTTEEKEETDNTVSYEGKVETREEYRAVWFCFSDFNAYREQYSENTKENFTEYFSNVIKVSKENEMNSIIVQVRPRADATYPSEYFPWSSYLVGEQGTDPGYDPLKIMVDLAHENGLSIEAWINPYRIGGSKDDVNDLDEDNPAKKWIDENSRNVLFYDGGKYFNPSKQEVRDLIVHGVEEIVQNYNVDGIHMDDYFYPTFSSSNVDNTFDAPEYNESQEKKDGMSIADYRRKQVNLLVKELYKSIKEINPNVRFGISPAGNIDRLKSDYTYYVDIDRWMSEDGYIDYICPQIYWGFTHPIAPYADVLDHWVSLRKNPKIDLYIGLAAYRVGHSVGASSSERSEWLSDEDILQKQIDYGREKNVDGFFFFDYEDFVDKKTDTAMDKVTDTFSDHRTITKETTKEKEYIPVIIHGDSDFSDYEQLKNAMNQLCKKKDIEILYLNNSAGDIAKQFADINKLHQKTFNNEDELLQYITEHPPYMMLYFSGGYDMNPILPTMIKMNIDVHILSYNKSKL